MENNKVIKDIIEEIIKSDTIIITRHKRPDGDCIGSSLGLRSILRESFPNKKVYSIGFDKAPYLSFLGEEDLDVDDEVYKDALIICLDTSVFDRIDNPKIKLGRKVIKIDHHIVVDNYGDINLVYEDAPACAEIISMIQNQNSDILKLTTEAAKCLYTAMVTDTGRFRFKNVSSKTMQEAGRMLEYGIDIEDIYMNLMIKKSDVLKLQAFVYKKFKTTENKVSYFYISQKTIKKFGTTTQDAANLVNLLDCIEGSLIWIAFIEQETKEIRARIRSRFIEIDKITSNYNGGGHKSACGATVDKKSMKKMLLEYDCLLKEFKENNGDKK